MSIKRELSERIVFKDQTLLFSLKVMDLTGFRSLIVLTVDELFVGVLSIGDIQRAIIRNVSLESPIGSIIRQNPRIAHENTALEFIRKEMIHFRMEFMPVIDKSNHLIKVYLWEDLFIDRKLPPKKHFELPVVIMAGGLGTRLKPLTNVLPKALLPIGEKTILEEIFNRFADHGCNDFYISVNYKAELIEFYIKSQNLPYNLTFIKEEKPMGTAGSLGLIKSIIKQEFFVTNCDILIEQDYSDILEYHKSNQNEITIVAALKHYPISYGIVESGKKGILKKIVEKPELTFKINSGMYILEPNVLNDLPHDEFFHITQLIEKVKIRKGKVGVFPVSEKSWKDIGEWDEYYKTVLHQS